MTILTKERIALLERTVSNRDLYLCPKRMVGLGDALVYCVVTELGIKALNSVTDNVIKVNQFTPCVIAIRSDEYGEVKHPIEYARYENLQKYVLTRRRHSLEGLKDITRVIPCDDVPGGYREAYTVHNKEGLVRLNKHFGTNIIRLNPLGFPIIVEFRPGVDGLSTGNVRIYQSSTRFFEGADKEFKEEQKPDYVTETLKQASIAADLWNQVMSKPRLALILKAQHVEQLRDTYEAKSFFTPISFNKDLLPTPQEGSKFCADFFEKKDIFKSLVFGHDYLCINVTINGKEYTIGPGDHLLVNEDHSFACIIGPVNLSFIQTLMS